MLGALLAACALLVSYVESLFPLPLPLPGAKLGLSNAVVLLSDGEEAAGYHAKFNTGAILRSDLKTQIDTLSTAVSTFIFTPNEAREKLDMPAKEGGDQLIGNGSTVPITAVGVQWGAPSAQQAPDGGGGTGGAP